MPAPPLTEKVSKNLRLTKVCVAMLERLANDRGITPAHTIEILVRAEAERRGLGDLTSRSK